ncbi:MAG TPA: cytochrome C oxidase subunit IV family protein [Chitinophagaceae bacterium]|nr:cytochrome C oxidase subunit IV family protein [Chitinophagaceae bacterium]
MDPFHNPNEVTFHHEPTTGTGRIWKTFWLLLIITVIELALGLLMYATDFPGWVDLFIKGVVVILSLAKAFYIVGIFMHLGDEIRNMIMTIVVPLLLFIWFIAAFLWDGNEYRVMRNRYDKTWKEQINKREIRAADTATHPLD